MGFKGLGRPNERKVVYEIGVISSVLGGVAIYVVTKNYKLGLVAIAFIALLVIVLQVVTKQRSYDVRILASGIEQLDKMSGEQFEDYMLVYFYHIGYSGYLTRITGDYGADLVIQHKDTKKKIVVQTKRWSNTVGVAAVQQACGAIKHYKADFGMVVTTNYFTKSAKELARSNGILLWDRDFLIRNTTKLPILNKLVEAESTTTCPICKGKLIAKDWELGTLVCCENYPEKCRYIRTT